jgi:Domain of unknown function (DUF1707)
MVKSAGRSFLIVPVGTQNGQVVHMDETRQDAARAAGRRRWPADGPQAGQPGGNRWDARPDLRVSDAERDAVVTELGEHFGQGRLDQAEFDERVTRALSARTGRDLGGLLADLPPAREESGAPQPGRRLPGLLILVPLLAAAFLIAGAAAGGWVLWPLWWLLPIMVLRFGWWHRGRRWRQWQ